MKTINIEKQRVIFRIFFKMFLRLWNNTLFGFWLLKAAFYSLINSERIFWLSGKVPNLFPTQL